MRASRRAGAAHVEIEEELKSKPTEGSNWHPSRKKRGNPDILFEYPDIDCYSTSSTSNAETSERANWYSLPTAIILHAELHEVPNAKSVTIIRYYISKKSTPESFTANVLQISLFP